MEPQQINPQDSLSLAQDPLLVLSQEDEVVTSAVPQETVIAQEEDILASLANIDTEEVVLQETLRKKWLDFLPDKKQR